MTTSRPPSIRLAQATTIALLTTTAGLSASLSLFVAPRLLESPTPLLTRQFGAMVSVTQRILPVPQILLPGLAHAYLAYQLPDKMRSYALAAAMSLSTAVWTWTVMMPINRKMGRKIQAVDAAAAGMAGAKEIDEILADEMAGGEETAHALVDKWATRNLYRPVVALLAGCMGLYAALS
ncbi:Uu.00g025390.m01.CDS01 [Anthostomella pinea]|uniref:Uu.00g025390.m01.CDS01 n=1 Tax=Anthostomella pinea TaxID=933095 RepID=A0AAI8V7B6_9PEZI|nr:Uu.00g025390.m01.CDS01 [Anthostomella pinea]